MQSAVAFFSVLRKRRNSFSFYKCPVAVVCTAFPSVFSVLVSVQPSDGKKYVLVLYLALRQLQVVCVNSAVPWGNLSSSDGHL